MDSCANCGHAVAMHADMGAGACEAPGCDCQHFVSSSPSVPEAAAYGELY